MSKNEEYDMIIKQLARKKMSKGAYRIALLGMYAKIIRSLLFNIAVLFVGISIGIGFTVLNIQRVWKEKYTSNCIHKLEHVLAKHGAIDNEVEEVLIELKDKQVEDSIKASKDIK